MPIKYESPLLIKTRPPRSWDHLRDVPVYATVPHLSGTSSAKEIEQQCPREQRPQQQGSHGEKVKVAEVLV